MDIKQFKDEPLAHYSYALISEGKMAVIDPSRNPEPYYKYAEENNATIVAVFETHPHADFISAHLQIHKQTGATIYVSKDAGADYPHIPFDEPDQLTMGSVSFIAINTPGHSPDSISIVAEENGATLVFTGDTLFVGDVGRPDLREKAGNMQSKRKELAKMMFHTIQNKYSHLNNEVTVYPAHGAGTLCGKNLSDADSSTMGDERANNWAFQIDNEDDFVEEIISGQPFIPYYFSYDVDMNNQGAENFEQSIGNVKFGFQQQPENSSLIIDTRDEEAFKQNHLPKSINIMARNDNDKFETWLGTLVKPDEKFSVVISSVEQKNNILERLAKIGYEQNCYSVNSLPHNSYEAMDEFDFEQFKEQKDRFTIVDIRNKSELKSGGKIFSQAIHIPLPELRNSIEEVPTDKPIVVHCAGGYRSAAGSSILEKNLPDSKVFDLSERIKQFQ